MVECPNCNGEYTDLGTHWRWEPSHRPELTQKQLEVTTGLLMGDGSIKEVKKSNSYLRASMISPNYLKYLDNIFGCLGTGVMLKQTAAEGAKNNRDRGFHPNAKEENYSDLYKWRTRSHPKFNQFREWYASGKKVWPENIELTPTVLKHWYVGDGHYDNICNNDNIEIAMANEVENTKKVSKYFTRSGLPHPSSYITSKRKDGRKKCRAFWTVEDSYELWDYMGEPLPDFKYKWPEEYR